jgi:hypothetical protein
MLCRMRTFALAPLLLLACSAEHFPDPLPVPGADAGVTADASPPPDGASTEPDAAAPAVLPAFMPGAYILVSGHDRDLQLCRTVICRHNENTDMIAWSGALWLVHRTALGQGLGPNCALHVYRSTDGGATFAESARIEAPVDRDLRDPHFYVVGSELHIEALTRVGPGAQRDSLVDTVAVNVHSSDGVAWSDQVPIGPHGWSFWRVKEQAGTYYTAAYQDGDLQVVLYASTDGLAWTAVGTIYDVSADTPLETELTFLPSGRLLALVRMDGTDAELLGDQGRLRTKVCWALPPYTTFACPSELDGERLDGPVSFFVDSRLFVIARKHLQGTGRKRTALFEITGTLEGGPIAIVESGVLPSAGDTSYAGVVFPDAEHALVSWYSSDLALDEPWVIGMADLSDIWLGQIDVTRL